MENIDILKDITKFVAKDEAYYMNPLLEFINSFILSMEKDGIEEGITENELTEILNCSTVAFLNSIPKLVSTKMESLSYKIVTKEISHINLTDNSFVEIQLNNSDAAKHILVEDNISSKGAIGKKYESATHLRRFLKELKINVASIFTCNEIES